MKARLLNRVQKVFILTAPVTTGLTVGFGVAAFRYGRGDWLVVSVLMPYLFPLLLYRFMNAVEPQKEGPSRLEKGVYNAWGVAIAIQAIYGVFPILEDLLKLLPGLYSVWLRLWGSRIGKDVFFPPGFLLVDRAHLEVGDKAVFGMGVIVSPHMVRYRGKRRLVYLKTVRVGAGAFIGGRSYLGPGSEISPRYVLPGFANMTINMKDQCLLPEPRLMPIQSLDAATADERKAWLKDLRPPEET